MLGNLTDRVRWPVTGLDFLEHQFALEHPEESDYDTVADIFSALASGYPEAGMDLTKSFLSGMIASLQVEKPARLKPPILKFISQFRRQIFDTGVQAMSEEEKRILFAAISSEVDMKHGKNYCRDILISAIMSCVSRRYLGLEHLNLLESLVSSIGFPTDMEVILATNLIPALADEKLLNGAILKTWVQVIWLDLHILFPYSEASQLAQSAIKKLFIRRPELMDDFRSAIKLQTQNDRYRRSSFEITEALEEICEDDSDTSTEEEELHASSMSLV
jgi:hypothetical protein